jgi:fructokinase
MNNLPINLTPQVLCLGEILIDCLADQPGVSLDQVESWTSYPGGAPANVACGLSKLGISSGFIGCLGADEPGIGLKYLLETTGVNIQGVQVHPTAPTRKIWVLRSWVGERIFAGFGGYPSHEFADTRLQANSLPLQLIATADYLVIGTLSCAYPASREAVLRAIEIAKKSGCQVVLDVNWRPIFWTDMDEARSRIFELIQQADFLKLSDEESQWLFGMIEVGAIAESFPQLQGIFVTAGENGCDYWLRQQKGHVPAFPVIVIDTTGAGDSFVAGLLHQFCQFGIAACPTAAWIEQVVSYACAVGALTTQRAGAISAQPSNADVERFLEQQNQ